MAGKSKHRGWGHLRKLPSGRWQASYIGPDLDRHTAPVTFTTKIDAEAWLAKEHTMAESDDWTPPKQRAARRTAETFGAYSAAWLAQRPLKARTIAHYRRLLDLLILPTFGNLRVSRITPQSVRVWYAGLDKDTPTQRAHAYALLKAVCKTAVDDDLLVANPCRVRGAGTARRVSRTVPATPAELATLIDVIPQRYKAMTALAGWVGLRYGELIELRRKDIDRKNHTVKVTRAAVLVGGAIVVTTPKSDAGIRTVPIPPHVWPLVRDHLDAMGVTGKDALLFPAASDPTKHLRSGTLAKVFYRARVKIGRPDLRFHDLRHTAGSNATRVGANLAEVMGMLGHSTAAAALRYQHQTEGRAVEIAAKLSQLAERAGR